MNWAEKSILCAVLVIAVFGVAFIFFSDQSVGEASRLKSLPGSNGDFGLLAKQDLLQKRDFVQAKEAIQGSSSLQETPRYCPQPTKPEQFCFDSECKQILVRQRGRDVGFFEQLVSYVETAPKGFEKQRSDFFVSLLSEMIVLHTDMDFNSNEKIIADKRKEIKENKGYISSISVDEDAGTATIEVDWYPDYCYKLTEAGKRDPDIKNKLNAILENVKACTDTKADLDEVARLVDFNSPC